LVLCGVHHAEKVMAGGRWVVEQGAISGLDPPALLKRHAAAQMLVAS
jgi:8-oxoguanine deaminase